MPAPETRQAIWETFDFFPEGLNTAQARTEIGKEALAEGSKGVRPFKGGSLASFPRIQTLLDKDFYATVKSQFVGCEPEKTVGITRWSPFEGVNRVVVAVYGHWPNFGIWDYCTILFVLKEDENGDFVISKNAPDGYPHWLAIKGDAPIRFTSIPLTNDGFPELTTDIYTNYIRSNWLVIASPYEYTKLWQYADYNRGTNQAVLNLPYMAADVKVYAGRLCLTGVPGYPYRMLYNENVTDFSVWNSLEIGEGSGDPNFSMMNAQDSLYIFKPGETYRLIGTDPLTWRVVKVLSQRGGCVNFPDSTSFGIVQVDEKGIYKASGAPDEIVPMNVKVPELRSNRYDLIPMFEKIQIDTQAQFDKGTYFHTAVENWGTEEVPIHILTLERQTDSTFGHQQVGGVDPETIAPTESRYQTFFVDQPGSWASYWLKRLMVGLGKVTDDAVVAIALYKYDGGDPADTDDWELIHLDVVDVINSSTSSTVETELDMPYYLEAGTEIGYIIEIVGISNSVNWHFKDPGDYDSGEASWNPSADGNFQAWGFRYYEGPETAFWQSDLIDISEVRIMGALIWKQAEFYPDWEDRVKLEYRYAYISDGFGFYTEWYNFLELMNGWGTSYYPAGGMLQHWNPVYNKFEIRISLKEVGQIPPFVDWILFTYSTETDEVYHPSGIEDRGRLYLSGLYPNHGEMIEIDPSGAIWRGEDRNLAYFTLWRDKLLAGTIRDGKLVHIDRDDDPDPYYGGSGNLAIDTGLIGFDDPRVKELKKVEISWIERSSFSPSGIATDFYLRILESQSRIHLSYEAKELEEEQLPFESEDFTTVRKTLRYWLQAGIKTAAYGIEIEANQGEAVANFTHKPWFELEHIRLYMILWPTKITKGKGEFL